jgi:transcription antitermination factor NusG
VSIASDPAAIDAGQIEDLRRAIDQVKTVSACPYVAGETVEIARGPLAGKQGVITRTRGDLLVVAIEMFRRMVPVEIDAADLKGND